MVYHGLPFYIKTCGLGGLHVQLSPTFWENEIIVILPLKIQ
jgi:hypothetical protein